MSISQYVYNKKNSILKGFQSLSSGTLFVHSDQLCLSPEVRVGIPASFTCRYLQPTTQRLNVAVNNDLRWIKDTFYKNPSLLYDENRLISGSLSQLGTICVSSGDDLFYIYFFIPQFQYMKYIYSLFGVFDSFLKLRIYIWKHRTRRFFSATRRLTSAEGASYLGGSGGMLLQEIFIIEHSWTLFPAFLEPKNQSFPGRAGVLSNSENVN